jgi:hypothetical protein
MGIVFVYVFYVPDFISMKSCKPPPRNRLSPRYINIATDRYNKHAGAAAQPKPKRTQEKEEKENNANTGSLTRTKTTRNRCALRRIPPHSKHTPKRRISSNTFNKENDDNAAAARTNPRVSPDTRKGLGKRDNRRPSGR